MLALVTLERSMHADAKFTNSSGKCVVSLIFAWLEVVSHEYIDWRFLERDGECNYHVKRVYLFLFIYLFRL